jgi:hypothetical protein
MVRPVILTHAPDFFTPQTYAAALKAPQTLGLRQSVAGKSENK